MFEPLYDMRPLFPLAKNAAKCATGFFARWAYEWGQGGKDRFCIAMVGKRGGKTSTVRCGLSHPLLIPLRKPSDYVQQMSGNTTKICATSRRFGWCDSRPTSDYADSVRGEHLNKCSFPGVMTTAQFYYVLPVHTAASLSCVFVRVCFAQLALLFARRAASG